LWVLSGFRDFEKVTRENGPLKRFFFGWLLVGEKKSKSGNRKKKNVKVCFTMNYRLFVVEMQTNCIWWQGGLVAKKNGCFSGMIAQIETCSVHLRD
jgi:hypothetical protein